MKISGRGESFLDGDFRDQWPKPESFSLKSGDQWTVVKRGPTYCNTYEVTAFDDAGKAWLEANNRRPTPETREPQ